MTWYLFYFSLCSIIKITSVQINLPKVRITVYMTCKLNQHWPSFWQQSVDNALSSAAATCSTDQRKLLSSELKQYTGNTHWF